MVAANNRYLALGLQLLAFMVGVQEAVCEGKQPIHKDFSA